MHHKHDDIEEELEHRKDELPISLKVKISKTIKEIRQKIPYKKECYALIKDIEEELK